jgi:hypothetical protein
MDWTEGREEKYTHNFVGEIPWKASISKTDLAGID